MKIKRKEWWKPIVVSQKQFNNAVEADIESAIVVIAKIVQAEDAQKILEKILTPVPKESVNGDLDSKSTEVKENFDIQPYKQEILKWGVKFPNPEKHHIVRDNSGSIVTMTEDPNGKKIGELNSEEVLDMLIAEGFQALIRNIFLILYAEATGKKIIAST